VTAHLGLYIAWRTTHLGLHAAFVHWSGAPARLLMWMLDKLAVADSVVICAILPLDSDLLLLVLVRRILLLLRRWRLISLLLRRYTIHAGRSCDSSEEDRQFFTHFVVVVSSSRKEAAEAEESSLPGVLLLLTRIISWRRSDSTSTTSLGSRRCCRWCVRVVASSIIETVTRSLTVLLIATGGVRVLLSKKEFGSGCYCHEYDHVPVIPPPLASTTST
jgi:hypothetical protein